MNRARHILVNALSMGGGGGLTVGREMTISLARCNPELRVTAVLINGHPLHERLRDVQFPDNCKLLWAPQRTSHILPRAQWERTQLPGWIVGNGVDAVIQLNGMVVPQIPVPSICHMQDPWPYVSAAWTSLRERAIALLKRQAHRVALRRAAAVTWTSDYLRRLVCTHHCIWPERSEIAYNGVPDEWILRARDQLPDWQSRLNEIITVSNVAPYKRHSLVVQALKELLQFPQLSDLSYRIVGSVDDHMRHAITRQAQELGVESRVIFERFVSDQELAQFYRRAKCFVLMSVCESFGIPAIEAMTFGTPVVTADCCAMPEVCADGAELCPPDDLHELVNRISLVLLKTDHAEQLRRNAAARVGKFSWSETSKKIHAVVEDVLLDARRESSL